MSFRYMYLKRKEQISDKTIWFLFQKRDKETEELHRQIAEKKALLQNQNDSNSVEAMVLQLANFVTFICLL